MGRPRQLVADFILSFMWVWSGVLVKIFVVDYLGLGQDAFGEIVKSALAIMNMFFFVFLQDITDGASYNPLTILAVAVSGDFSDFIYCVGARIPTQVLGSVMGVRLLIDTIPEVGRGPRLNIDIHQGALTEGLLTFVVVTIALGLSTKIPGSSYMKTWIYSVSKLALQILGSDLTGGCMNPASATGWAYARGDHLTGEHILVYWLAPIEATVLAVWTFKLIVRPLKGEKRGEKSKSD